MKNKTLFTALALRASFLFTGNLLISVKGTRLKSLQKAFYTIALLCLLQTAGKTQAGAALDFDGVDDYVDLGSTALKPLSALTAEVWAYQSSWPGTTVTILGNTEASGYAISTTGTNLSASVRRNGSFGVVSIPLTGVSAGWHHIALTYDGQYTRLYLDGLFQGSNNAGSIYTIDYISNNTLFGTESYTGAVPEGSGYLLGKLDEIRIWNIARTACEIADNMNVVIPTTGPGLLGNYHFDQGIAGGLNTTVIALVDASGNGNTGTLGGMTLTGSTSNWVAPGAPLSPVTLTATASSIGICTGQTATLSASGPVSYTWTGGPVSTDFVVSPTVTTSYTVTGTGVGGCTTQVVQTILVNTTPTLSISGTTVVCSGSLTTITANGASNYAWSGGPGTAGYAVSPATTSNYTVTGTSAFGCTNTAVQTVSVNATPTLAFSGTTVICSGSLTTITASGASTYTWSGGPATAGYAVSPATTTNYTVTGTASGCTNTAVQSVSVNVTPTIAVSGTSIICSGSLTTITASGADSYNWVSGPATAGYGVNPPITTDYTVTGTTAASGCTNSAVQSVSVNATPTLAFSGTTVICTGSLTTITASGANSYVWSGGPATAGYAVSPATTTNYTVTGTNTTGGCTNTAVQTVSVNTTPTISISGTTVICSGGLTAIIASGANSYLWSGGPAIAGYAVSPATTTDYTVTGTTAASGCTNSAIQTVSVNATPTLAISGATVICSGSLTTITASGANSYLWSGGSATAAYAVSPASTTNYTVTGTNTTGGCSNMAFQTVSVNTTPTVSISGPTVICNGNLTTITAGGASIYQWNGGPATAGYAVNPATTTNYTVAGTNTAGGCTNTAVQTVFVANPTISISGSTVICSGSLTTITASGASSYTWSGGPSTAVYALSPTITTDYTVTGTASGCTTTAVQTVSVNTTPTIAVSGTSIICSGSLTTITASGANSYNWSGGPATAGYAVSPATATNYTVTGTDTAGGCTNTAVQSVSVNATPTLAFSGTTVICSGSLTTITASGASSYLWSVGPATAGYAVSPATTTNYTVTGTNTTGGCTNTAAQTVSVNATPTISISGTTVICGGSLTTITAAGAVTYVWSGGPSTAGYAVSPAATSNYTVTGTASGCTNTAVKSVSVNTTPTLAVSGTTVICSGISTTLTASGANSYNWIAGPATSGYTVSPVTTTNYTVTGTNTAGGCTNTAVQTVSANAIPTISISGPTVICSGSLTTITAGGANSYVWSGGPATAGYAVSPATTTNYTVTGTASGCTNTAVQSVSVNVTPTIAVSGTSIICSGSLTTITASGANSYNWVGGPATAGYGVSPAVTTDYTVTGTTAASGCTNSAVQSVSVNATPTLAFSGTTVICTGSLTTITASGADSYVWSSGPATAGYAVSPATTTNYTVTGTNTTGGCTNTAVQTVSVNATPTISISGTTVICSGSLTTITASGASTYTWSGGPSTAAYAVNPATTTIYTVTGTASGCTNTAVQSVSVNSAPALVVSGTTVICSGSTTTITASGANTYTWSGGPAAASYVVGPATTSNYTVTGTTTAGGCTNTAVQTVSVNATPTISISGTTVICSGSLTTITASGANSYVWSGGPATAGYAVSPAVTTNYTVTGTASGCTNTAVRSVSVNATPTVTISASSTVICSGRTTTLTASGANSYVWVSGPSTVINAVSPPSTNDYTVTGTTTASGCTNTAVQTVSVNATPTVVISSTPGSSIICTGKTSTLTGNGANTYVWTSGPFAASYPVSPLTTTNYTVTGTNTAGGCTNTAVQQISVNTTPTITVAPSATVICSGSVSVLSAGGASSYTWTSGPSTANYTVTPSTTTAYTVTGTTAISGCTNTAVQSISVNTTPVLTITPSSTVICVGLAATLTVSGATTYTWSSGPSTAGYTVNPVTSTSYTVTGTTSGCTNTAVRYVSVNPIPVLTLTPTSTLICSGTPATIVASGANTYTWTGGPVSGTYVVSPPSNANFTVTGRTTASGCTNTAVQSISVNATPTLVIATSSTVICSGNSATLTGSGAVTLSWTAGPSAAVYTMSPLSTANYTLFGSTNNCTNTLVQTLSVNITPTLNTTASPTVICSGKVTNLSASGANTYVWTGGPSTAVYAATPQINTTFTVTGMVTASGCTNTAVRTISVNASPTLNIASTGTAICIGNSETLTATGADTYSWTGGPTVPVYTMSPLSTTNYTLRGTDASNGCTAIAVYVLTVNPLPVIGITPLYPSVCYARTTTLIATGATNYSWTNGPGSGSFVITPLQTSTYIVSATIAATGCENTAMTSVTVYPNPTVTVNSGSVCTGNSFIISSGGAVTFTWSNGAHTGNIVVSPVASSIYTLIGGNIFGCTDTVTSSVLVGSFINVGITSNSTTVCAGDTVILSGSGANSYLWNNSATGSTIAVTPTVATTYSVIGSSGPSCSNTANQVIIVNPGPNILVNVPALICANRLTTLNASGAVTYTWSNGSNLPSAALSPSATSVYTVSGSNSFNCSSSTTFVVNTTTLTAPALCLVTVDSVGKYNEIYWDKTLFPQADSFIVSREAYASVYLPIARLHKSAFSSYIDTNRSIGYFNGDPNYTFHRYKLQYKDSCNNLSPMSPYHQTIFVHDQKNGNFNWNYYNTENGGPLQTVNYILWRRHIVTGATSFIAGTGGTSISDPTYQNLAPFGNTKWYIEAQNPGFNCNPSARESETMASKVKTKSNNTNERQFPTPAGISVNSIAASNVSIYPNPVENVLTLDFGSETIKLEMELRDLTGRIVLNESIDGSKYQLSTGGFSNGVYFVSLYDSGKLVKTHKIIVQH